VAGFGIGLGVAVSGGGSSNTQTGSTNFVSPPPLGPAGPEGPPLETGPNLAPAASPAPGQTVDGIECQLNEQVAFHIHSRLTIFVNGKPEKVPYGVGIANPKLDPGSAVPFVGGGDCFSWLHTHAADGVIHIESPTQRTYTLGNFFDIWSQPLSSTQVGPAKGNVTALVDGKVWTGDPRDIPMHEHTQIQLDVGHPLVGAVNIPSSSWGQL